MKSSFRPLLAALLGLAASMNADRPFRLFGDIGLYARRQDSTLGLGAPGTSETSISGLVNLNLSSAFWSRKVLRYTLSLSALAGNMDEPAGRSDTDGFGYGISLHLFPEYRNQFTVWYRRDSYSQDRESQPFLDQDSTQVGFTGTLAGWFADFQQRKTESATDPYSDRLASDGQLRRKWRLGSADVSLSLRHFNDEFAFFNTSDRRDVLLLTSYIPLGNGDSVYLNLEGDQQRYEDTGLGFSSDRRWGIFSGQWDQHWTYRWSTHLSLGLSGTDQDQQTMMGEVRTWYALTEPFKIELSAQSSTLKQGDERYNVLGYGGGIFYSGKLSGWLATIRSGFLTLDSNQPAQEDRSGSLYAQLGFSRRFVRTELEVNADYQQYKLVMDLPPGVEPPPGWDYSSRWTRDYGRAWTDLHWFVSPGVLTLRWLSSFSNYQDLRRSEEVETRLISNQVEGILPRGTIGMSFDDSTADDPAGELAYSSLNAYVRLTLTRALSLDVHWIRREERYGGLSSDELDSFAALTYGWGKFLLALNYQELQYEDLAVRRERRTVSLTVKRLFGAP